MTVYTQHEVAKMCKVTTLTIVRRIKKGELAAFKIGTCWRITEEQLKDWIESRTMKAKRKTA